jgi:hypothetical protein
MRSKKSIVLFLFSTLAATNVSAHAAGTQSWAPNLSGLYRCVHSCVRGQMGRIVAWGRQLTLIGEGGEAAKAWIDWPGHIWVPALNEGAVYSADGFTIQFERGSVWVLVEPQPIPGSAGY